MPRTFTVGVVGCGRIATMHLENYLRLGGAPASGGRVKIVAACDTNPDMLAKKADRFDIPRRYRSAAELANDPEIEVVSVLTPPDARREVIEPLLVARKHLLVEKPLSLSFAEARQLVEQAEAAGVHMAVNHNYRLHGPMRRLWTLLGENALGAVHQVTLHHTTWRDESAGWRHETPRLALAVMGSHWVDLLRAAARSEMQRVYAAARRTGLLSSAGEDVVSLIITFENACLGTLVHSWASGTHRTWMHVDGSEASAAIDLDAESVELRGRDGSKRGQWHEPRAHPESFGRALETLLDTIETGIPGPLNARDNLGTVMILDAAYRSIDGGRIVEPEHEWTGLGAPPVVTGES